MRMKWRINWDVVFTLIALIVMYAVTLCVIYFTWIGAEYTFDKAVHFGVVDSYICCLLSYYFVRWVYRMNQKFRKKV